MASGAGRDDGPGHPADECLDPADLVPVRAERGRGVRLRHFASAQAAIGFEPPDSIRADQIMINGVRLPYLKFPRNPTF